MLNPDFEVMDRTDGDADKVQGTVIIHDVVSNNPSMIAYNWEIAEALEELSGPLPDDYEHLPEECETAWIRGADLGTMDGLEAALGVRIEHFEDFLKEHSGEWIAPGGRIVRDEPTWTYPDDVDRQDRQTRQTDKTGEDNMTTTIIDNGDLSSILDRVENRIEQWGEELRIGGWIGSVGIVIESEPYEGYAPHIGAGFSLERGKVNRTIAYDPEMEYLEGTDDENYPINQIYELLMKYEGNRPYWYNMILRIHPEDGVRLRVIG